MDNDTLVRESIANTQKLTGTVVQFLTSRILPITHLTKVTWDRAVLIYALVKGWSTDIGLEIQTEILCGEKDLPSFIFPNLITYLCCRAQAEHVVALDLQRRSVGSNLHALNRKLDILAHQLHHVQPLNMATCPSELDAPSLHFGLPDDDEFGPRSEESEDEFADNADGDGVGPSGHT
ncbi:hypothetical protein ACH5RR_018470 [Cinchona calisaya]|uniref:Uncharacterized protein n=1 Tax=Cinchona calisaya TaxID=153742 RepID=A0ABD2ZLN2_9GENT